MDRPESVLQIPETPAEHVVIAEAINDSWRTPFG